VFLDANILISASISPTSRFLDFWRLRAVTVVTSPYVTGEARKHLTGDALYRFELLRLQMEEAPNDCLAVLPSDVDLVEKDRPVLMAALAARARYLITGDKAHFGHLYGTSIDATTILAPRTFLDQEEYRL
jgi:predicted nucleic acid-binding protein